MNIKRLIPGWRGHSRSVIDLKTSRIDLSSTDLGLRITKVICFFTAIYVVVKAATLVIF